MAKPQFPGLDLTAYSGAGTPIKSAERAVAKLFEAKPPTREERELADVARSQLVQIALEGGKAKLGQQELVSLVTHTDLQFQRGSGYMFALQALPKVNAAHEHVTNQFTGICIQALNRYLQGAMENGAAVIGETIATPIETKQQQKGLLALLAKL